MNQYLATHQLELIATFCGLLNIDLAARANIWNWFFGILTVSLYLIIFMQVKLYADMSLQLIFFCLQFYGLYQWLYGSEQKTALNVDRASFTILYIASAAAIILFAGITFILHTYTDSTTVIIDALTTALSLVAQWMMSKKWLENWLVWMLVDIISVGMYINKHLYFTSILYSVLFLICIYGYYTWRKQYLENSKASLPLPTGELGEEKLG